MPWKPGESGNPSGRPKELREVTELARSKCKRSIERLAEWVESDNPKASVAACIAMLDRGIGKSAQPVEHSGLDGGPLTVNVCFVESDGDGRPKG